MGTHIPPTPHKKLEEVLSLTRQLESYEQSLRIKFTKRAADRRGLDDECRTRKEKRVFSDSLARLGVEIRVLEEKISLLNVKLKKLPRLCQWCKGERLVKTGYMTDRICPSCCGDGLEDGPNQRAHRRTIARMVKKMRGRQN